MSRTTSPRPAPRGPTGPGDWPGSGRWRAARTAVFAVAATQLAVLGHLAGNGHAPDPTLLLLALAASALTVHPLSRQRLSLPVLLAATTTGQLVFHVLFALAGHPAGTAAPSVLSEVSPRDAALSMTGSSALTVPMVAFHLAAAGATALVLAHGESALFRMLAAWHRTVHRVGSRPAVPVGTRRRVVPTRTPTALSDAQLAAVRVVRGPPRVVPAR